MIAASPGNDNHSTPTLPEEPGWDVEICDWSIAVNHKDSGLRFYFRRSDDHTSLSDDIDISGDEDHPEFEDILDEAIQIAHDCATEE